MVSASFDLLRHASRDTAPVLQQMLDVIAAISREAASPGPRTSLLPQVRLIREEARSSNLIEEDRQSIGRSADLLKTTLTCPM